MQVPSASYGQLDYIREASTINWKGQFHIDLGQEYPLFYVARDRKNKLWNTVSIRIQTPDRQWTHKYMYIS